jgi:ankyrin repeat protein
LEISIDFCPTFTGNTPLHILLSNNTEEYGLAVKLLLERGAPLYARNQNDASCFEIIRQKSPNLLKMLRGIFMIIKGRLISNRNIPKK